ncbi:MAG: hypothetical protein WBV73_02935, partial [Phormidium sp.]
YFQITFKVNELFNGFGRQRPIPRPRPRDLPVVILPHLQPFTVVANQQENNNNLLSKISSLAHLIHETNPSFQREVSTNQQSLIPIPASNEPKNISVIQQNLTFANQPKLNLTLTTLQPHIPIIPPLNSLTFNQGLTNAAPLIGTREWVVEKTPTQETQTTQESIISELRQKFLNVEFQVPNLLVK